MKTKSPALFLLALLVSPTAFATEIYHWVDENGVANFSSTAPPGHNDQVKTVVLDDSPAPRYDPEKDPFDVEGQAERMSAYREEMTRRREAAAKRRAAQPQPQPVQYQNRYIGGAWWNRPYYPRPPVSRPNPPVAVPYETATFRPPGHSRN